MARQYQKSTAVISRSYLGIFSTLAIRYILLKSCSRFEASGPFLFHFFGLIGTTFTPLFACDEIDDEALRECLERTRDYYLNQKKNIENPPRGFPMRNDGEPSPLQ
jgi:hypothetical protein